MEKKGGKSGKQKVQSKGKKNKNEEEVKAPTFNSIYEKNGSIFIVVHAKPGSKQDAITAVEPDYVGVSVKDPPIDGEANEGIREFVASVLGLKKRDIEVAKGGKSHDKLLEIDSSSKLSVDTVVQLLKSAMS